MSPSRRAIVVLATWALVSASSAHASTFNVNPIRIQLSQRGSSTLLTVHNTSEEPIRFQLSTFAWTQSTAGKVELAPTRDIIFFPRMMTLEPGAKRNVRIGMSKAAAKARAESAGEGPPTERTYRIFVEELPSRKTKAEAGQIQVLTRMSIPIFVAPPAAEVKLSLGKGSFGSGRFTFDVRNKGTVHTMLKKVTATAMSKANKPLFSRDLAGWYLLANGVRTFEVEVPQSLCGKISHFEVTVTSEEGAELPLRYDAPPGACASR